MRRPNWWAMTHAMAASRLGRSIAVVAPVRFASGRLILVTKSASGKVMEMSLSVCAGPRPASPAGELSEVKFEEDAYGSHWQNGAIGPDQMSA